MARIRTVKPEFRTDLKLASCSRDARLTFVYLISEADDYGLLLARPRQLLGALYPHEENVTPAMLMGWIAELERIGSVRRRETSDGQPVLEIVHWSRHQKVDKPGAPRLRDSLTDTILETPPLESRDTLANDSRLYLGPGTVVSGTVVPGTSDLLSAPRKQRASRPKESSKVTWLTPFARVWEEDNDRGSFKYGQAARPLKALKDAGWEDEEIARRLGWYSRIKGVENGEMMDTEKLAQRYFKPDFELFWQRFKHFDPSGVAFGFEGGEFPAWMLAAEKCWTENTGYLVNKRRLHGVLDPFKEHGEAAILDAIARFAKDRQAMIERGEDVGGSIPHFTREAAKYFRQPVEEPLPWEAA